MLVVPLGAGSRSAPEFPPQRAHDGRDSDADHGNCQLGGRPNDEVYRVVCVILARDAAKLDGSDYSTSAGASVLVSNREYLDELGDMSYLHYAKAHATSNSHLFLVLHVHVPDKELRKTG
jgi:hypothetical protein